MQFKALLILASGLSAVTSWKIPEDAADGVYKVSTDSSGVSTHTPVSPIVKMSFMPRGTRTKRTLQGNNNVQCVDYGLLAVDANNAVQALKNQCQGGSTGGGEVSGNNDFYSISNDVAAYFCNYSSQNNHCYQDEITDAIQSQLTTKCGPYAAGYDLVEDRGLEYGYMHKDAAFCGRGK